MRLATDSSQSAETEEGECSMTSESETSEDSSVENSGTIFFVLVIVPVLKGDFK